MILLPLATMILYRAPMQGIHGGNRFAMVYGRASEAAKVRQTEEIKSHYTSARTVRQEQVEASHQSNQNEQSIARVARQRVTQHPGAGKEEIRSYVADLDLPVINENEKPVASQLPLEVFIKRGDSEFVRKDATFSRGQLHLTDIELPVLVEVKIAAGAETDGWAISGDVQDFAVIIPASPQGMRLSSRTEMRTVEKKRADGEIQKKEVETTWIVEKLNMTSAKPLRLHREVADFVLPKPRPLASHPDAKIELFLGDQEAEKSILSDFEDATSWKFRIRRDAMEGGALMLVVQAVTPDGCFGSLISTTRVDYYGENVLQKPELELESIPYGSVKLLGRAVGPELPVSPIMWIDDKQADAGPPRAVTGADACNLLHLTPDPKNISEPAPREREKARFGRWLNFPEQGLSLRCRYELDSKIKRIDRAVLPDRSSQGVLEAIRIYSPEAGSVGSLRVGSTRAEVEATFGEFDPHFDLSVIGLTPQNRATLVYGQASVEAPDDTLMRDGIRIKWQDDKVKWFEISRPIQLLYNGTRAFQPPPPKTFYIDFFKTNNLDIVPTVTGRLREWANLASGFVPCSSRENADVVVSGVLNTDGEARQVCHTYIEKVETTDDKGNVETTYQERHELFSCPEVSVRADLALTIESMDGRSDLKKFDWHGGMSSGHDHQQGCRCPDVTEFMVLRDLLLFKGKKGASIQRQVSNIFSDLSEVTGTVVAINYETGQMLINIGRDHGIRKKSEQEGTEFDVFVFTEVDPLTGASLNPDLENQRLMGKNFDEWVEVEEVGEDWCVAVPKKRENGFLGTSTRTAYGQIPRLIDPGSGLLRVRVKPKGIAKKS